MSWLEVMQIDPPAAFSVDAARIDLQGEVSAGCNEFLQRALIGGSRGTRDPMSTAAVRRYWDQVAALGCVICGGPAEIAHCHGGSITERMQEPKAKGKKLATPHMKVVHSKTQDLMEQLKASLNTGGKRKAS